MQHWIKAVVSCLPATCRELNTNPVMVQMNRQHRKEREEKGHFINKPVNGMVYDTLMYLRNKGLVVRRTSDGVYMLTEEGKEKLG
jgi:hypothetical protein